MSLGEPHETWNEPYNSTCVISASRSGAFSALALNFAVRCLEKSENRSLTLEKNLKVPIESPFAFRLAYRRHFEKRSLT
eukprot:1434459-Pleurochrysis_carterae.AAC.1